MRTFRTSAGREGRSAKHVSPACLGTGGGVKSEHLRHLPIGDRNHRIGDKWIAWGHVVGDLGYPFSVE